MSEVLGCTLLLVDDEEANLDLLEVLLEGEGYTALIRTSDAREAIPLWERHAPDLVLLDLHLPDISGEEVLRRLRADPRTAGIPVVVVSADATAASLERLRVAGADAYLTKPLDIEEFLTVVDRILPGVAG